MDIVDPIARTLTAQAAGAGERDPCAGIDCSSHGFCMAVVDSYVCMCDAGYQPNGRHCHSPEDEANVADEGSPALAMIELAKPSAAGRPVEEGRHVEPGKKGGLKAFFDGENRPWDEDDYKKWLQKDAASCGMFSPFCAWMLRIVRGPSGQSRNPFR